MGTELPSKDRIFNVAAELLDPAARADYLDDVCADDPELRLEIEDLLKRDSAEASFLKSPVSQYAVTTDSPPISEHPGTVIGPYKLLQQIGEGGMGVVFMAEQTEPIQRTVALKIIKPGMDTRQVIARFEAERQALAMMDHPNIARVLDAGTTQTGRPYFVMDLVKGVPITDYCDQQHLTVRQRLELFTQVCHAVQHAHQKGIIHRDLKPSNVLVAEYDGNPVPKVIDFGVAKATAQRLTERTMFTQYGQIVGTFEYMSPEQARFNQLDVDTRSDIYSLGVLLYELLAGSTPLEKKRLRSAAFDEILRIISEEDPPLPSTRLSSSEALPSIAANRSLAPKKLTGLVSGEIDWIVMKCLEKDRNRRYETANSLAMDLQRYFNDEPVEARAASQMYRLKKFIRRNKGGVLAGSAITAALIVGLGLSTWLFVRERTARVAEAEQRTEAERQRKQAEANEKKALSEANKSQQVANFLQEMLRGFGPGVAHGRDATLMREILDKNAQRVGQAFRNQPEVEMEVRTTLGWTYHDLGDYEQAQAMLRRALAISKKLYGSEHLDVAKRLGYVAFVLKVQGKQTEAETMQREALAVQRKLLRVSEHPDLAFSLNGLANVLQEQGKLAEAEIMYREALAMRRKLLGNDDLAVTSTLYNLGSVLRNQDKLTEAEAMFREALAVQQKVLGSEHPHVARTLNGLSLVLYHQGKLTEAEATLREMLVMQRKMLGSVHPEEALSLANLASVLRDQGKLAEAEAMFREALAMQHKLLGSEHPDSGRMLERLSGVLYQESKVAEAEAMFREALAARRKAVERMPNSAVALYELAWMLATSPFEQLRDPSRAVELVKQASVLEPTSADFLNTLGVAHYRAGNWQGAIDQLHKSMQVRVGGDSLSWFFLAMAHQQLDHKEEARKWYDQAVEWTEKNKWNDLELRRFRAEAAKLLGITVPQPSTTRSSEATASNERPDIAGALSHLAPLALARGNAHAAGERWNEAVADFSRAVELDPNDEQASFSLAVALLKNAKEADYRRHCHTYLERIAETRSFTSADKAAKASLLLPVDRADFERACKLADFAATATEPSHLLPWMHMGKALAEYRRAHFDSANEWADRCLSADNVAPECQAAALFIQAAVGARLDQTEAARAALAKGEELAKQPRSNVNLSWLDWAIADILRREAAELLGISEPAPSTGSATQP